MLANEIQILYQSLYCLSTRLIAENELCVETSQISVSNGAHHFNGQNLSMFFNGWYNLQITKVSIIWSLCYFDFWNNLLTQIFFHMIYISSTNLLSSTNWVCLTNRASLKIVIVDKILNIKNVIICKYVNTVERHAAKCLYSLNFYKVIFFISNNCYSSILSYHL